MASFTPALPFSRDTKAVLPKAFVRHSAVELRREAQGFMRQLSEWWQTAENCKPVPLFRLHALPSSLGEG